MSTPISNVFNGGEISPLMLSRPDQPKYQHGCLRLRNMICLAQGGVTRRPGMLFLGYAKDQNFNHKVRLVPFIFSTTESRVLELGEGYGRVWKDDALVTKDDATYEFSHNWTSTELPLIRTSQTNDVIWTASWYRPPSKISRLADDNWVVSVINFTPTTPIPTGISAAATVGVPSTGKRTYKYAVTALDADTAEESLPSAEASVTTDLLNATDGNYIDISWTANTVEPLEYRVYKYEAGVFGFIGRVDGTEVSPTFRDDNINADEEDTPPSGDNPFSGASKYPRIVFQWQQRLGWANSISNPFGVWLSPSALFESMAASKPPADDDAVTATLAAPEANGIQWVASDRSLLVGTSGNEWIFGPTDSNPLTPSSGFSGQGDRGSEFIPPLKVSGTLLYVQQGGDTIREFSYSFTNDRYEATDATIIASHLFDNNKTVDWCYQQRPYSVAWVQDSLGGFKGLTYMKEHEVVGWHSHETAGTIESLCRVPGPQGDRIYFVTVRTLHGNKVRCIERFGDYFIKDTDPADAFFVDCGKVYEGAPVTILEGFASHLVGEEVEVWADGAEIGLDGPVPSSGNIVLPRAASKVAVGLHYDSDLRPTRPESVLRDGTTLTRVSKVSNGVLRLYKSIGVLCGRTEAELDEVLMHDAADPVDPRFLTGDVELMIDTGFTEEWNVLVRSSGPAPLTALSITYNVELGETI